MCIGGGSAPPAPKAPPPAPPAPAPVTIQRLQRRPSGKVTRAGKARRRGTSRGSLVIKKTTGVQYGAAGTGVSV